MISPRTFVLVHGAWHGGWCWRRVADHLRRDGHQVFTPTLTGVGERVHLIGCDISLATHIADVVNVIISEDLQNVVLCGHSYGGFVISGVAEKAEARIAARLKTQAAWQVHDLSCGHDAMVDMPEAVAEILAAV
jgi:pimeloyl-ACP methyl ester carboxylesterase